MPFVRVTEYKPRRSQRASESRRLKTILIELEFDHRDLQHGKVKERMDEWVERFNQALLESLHDRGVVKSNIMFHEGGMV